MSRGHMHLGGAHMTQNQGNQLGDRPCVRQSKNYRELLGGNAMKEIMGQDNLKWNTTEQEGAYAGRRVFDGNSGAQQQHPQQQQPMQYQPEQPQYQHHQQAQPLAAKAANVAPEPSGAKPTDRDAAGIDAMRHRRGAGQANRTTYNFMTGQ